jgi:iron complex outermembrane receptor protein
VRKFFVLLGLAFCLDGFAQNQVTSSTTSVRLKDEVPGGVISGHITTTDGQPAAYVNISLRGTNKYTTSDEQGTFTLRNVKEGVHTIEISMTGLKMQEKTVEVKKDETITVNIILQEDAKQLSEIIITGRRSLNEKIMSIGKLQVAPRDLPQAMTVIDKSILERQQVAGMSDALQNVNGVYIMGTTAGIQDEIAARGYAFGSSNTFKNGARFNNGIKPEFSSVEKVEVLKGGNAILYGNVGAGGILNIVTKKPRFEQGGEISFRAGSYNFYKPYIDIYGPFSKSKHAAYRVNTTYEKAGSFRDNVESERIYLNPSFLFKAGEKTEIILEGDYLKDERTPDYGTAAINYTIADMPRNRFLNVPWAYNNTDQYTATGTVTHTINDHLNIRGIISYQSYNNELFSANRPNNSGAAVAPDGTWTRGLQKTRTDEDYYFSSIDLNAKFNTGSIDHTILFGADADRYKTTSTAFKTYANIAIGNKNIYDTINVFDPSGFDKRGDMPFMAEDKLTTSPIMRYGIYVQDLVSLLPKLKVLAGVRYSYQNNERATVDTVSKNKKGFIDAYENDAFSPRLGVVYQPTKTVSIFASYTNSFSVNTGVDVNNKALAPSVIDQVEAGIKNDFFHGALSANLTIYKIVNSNYAQTALFLADGTTPNNNSNIKELNGETTSKGVEIDMMTKPVNGFNIIAGYSYNDMRFTGVNGNTVNGNKEGERLRYNPAHTANASVFYTFEKESLLNGFNAGLGAFYVGNRLAGRNPTNSPTNTNKLMPLPDYVTIDLNAGYVRNDFSVRVKLSNLLNQLSYNVHDDNSLNPVAPRQFLATVAYKF